MPKLIDDETLDSAWADYERALDAGIFGEPRYDYGPAHMRDRELDAHLKLPAIRALQNHPAILAWTDLFFDRKTVPFQTIMGHAGTQQKSHSDSIHMTTYPLGYLVASWLAFEIFRSIMDRSNSSQEAIDCPIFSAPRSELPPANLKHGYSRYQELYEPFIDDACRNANLERKLFIAKKGDVLFWHANLVHGGSQRGDLSLTRKSLVCHYFAERVITYHDLAGLATRLHKNGMDKPLSI